MDLICEYQEGVYIKKLDFYFEWDEQASLMAPMSGNISENGPKYLKF